MQAVQDILHVHQMYVTINCLSQWETEGGGRYIWMNLKALQYEEKEVLVCKLEHSLYCLKQAP